MNRQQKRRDERVVTKEATRKKPTPAAKNQLAGDAVIGGTSAIRYKDLNDRQRRGYEMWRRSQSQNGMCVLLSDTHVWWFSQSDPNRGYHVIRQERNRRGTMVLEYRCDCGDFLKRGEIDCKHIFADKIRRGEVAVEGAARTKPVPQKKATRRPPRKRLAYDGRTVRSAHRTAKRALPVRIPELTFSLVEAFDRDARGIVIPIRPQRHRGGKRRGADSARAATLVLKVASGRSVSEMMQPFQRMIEDGALRLRNAPNEDTFSDWMNDERLTPVLREFLRMTSLPYREREIGAIIDSSKVSQLMTAHQRTVEYDFHDKRPGADWVKCHALVGVETLVVMAVEFSGVYGPNTHDVNFVEPLVETAIKTFALEYMLGDKAYLTSVMPKWLADRGIKAVIPLKKRWFQEGTRLYNESLTDHIDWFKRNENRDFHEIYRFRPKVECLFSVLKRTAQGHCWSKGRKRKTKNANEPCTAWINELLCKFIYMNLRTTVNLEQETGVKIDYCVPSRRFPQPDEPLLKKRAA